MKKILLILCASLTACSVNQEQDGAIAHTKSSKYNEESIALLRKNSANGDAHAMYSLGMLYLNGKSIEKNELKGLELIRLSAEKEYDLAILFMGNVYALGRYGAQKDINKARDYWLKLANKNNMIAQIFLGESYQMSKDYKNAFEWYTKAYKNGSFFAAFYIGTFYEFGFYVKKDFQKALKYYQEASNKGSILADNRLGFLYFTNPLIKNYEKAYLYFMKAANNNYPIAQRFVGILTVAGLGVKADFEKGLSWLRKAGANGDKEAAKLAVIYSTDPEIMADKKIFQEKLKNAFRSKHFTDAIDAKLKLKEEIEK